MNLQQDERFIAIFSVCADYAGDQGEAEEIAEKIYYALKAFEDT